MSTGDVIQVVVKASAVAVPIVNTYHYMMGTGSPPPDLPSFSGNWGALVGSALLGILTGDYSGVEIVSTVIAGINLGMQYIDTSWLGQNGTVAGVSAPLTTCYVGQRRTGFAKRSGRGRVFASPIGRGVFDETGMPIALPAGEAAFLTSLLAVVTDSSPSSFLPCLYNRVTHLATPCSAAERSQRAGIQRHRRERI